MIDGCISRVFATDKTTRYSNFLKILFQIPGNAFQRFLKFAK